MNESFNKNKLAEEISKLEDDVKILEESNDDNSYTSTEIDKKKEILDNIAKDFGYVFEDPYIIKLEKIEKKLDEQLLTIGIFNEYMKEINETEATNPILQESEINEIREILKKEEPKKEEIKEEEPKKEEGDEKIMEKEEVEKEEVIEKPSIEKLIEQLTELANEKCTTCGSTSIGDTGDIWTTYSNGLQFNLDLTKKLKKIIDNNTDNEKIKLWLTKEYDIRVALVKVLEIGKDLVNKTTDHPYEIISSNKARTPIIIINNDAINNLTHLNDVYKIIATEKVIDSNKLKKDYNVVVVDPLQHKDSKNNYSEIINDLIKDLREQKGGEPIEKRIKDAIRKKIIKQKRAELKKKLLKIIREELGKKKAIWEQLNSVTKNRVNTMDYSRPLMALISYKIGNLNQYDIRIIEYCQNANLNDQVIIAIILAQKKADINAIFQNYRIMSHGLLLNVLRLKKLSAEFQFRQDYGIHNDQHLFVLAQKQRIW